MGLFNKSKGRPMYRGISYSNKFGMQTHLLSPTPKEAEKVAFEQCMNGGATNIKTKAELAGYEREDGVIELI